MEEQGKILKTFLIASVIYTLAFGAPVKRDTTNAGNTITACALASIKTLCPNTTYSQLETWLSCSIDDLSDISVHDTGLYLEPLLQNDNFKRAVSKAVRMCIKNSDSDQKKCELATAAVTLQTTIRGFIAEYRKHGQFKHWIDCNISTDKADMKKTLCVASAYTLKVLAKVYTNWNGD